MLPRILSIILLLASIVLAGKLIYDSTIFEFWSTRWVIGTLCTLALISAGIGLLFLDDKDMGYLTLCIFGCIYVVASVFVYIFWGYQHIVSTLRLSRFFGFIVLFVIVCAVGGIGLWVYAEKKSYPKIFIFPATCYSFSNLGSIFLVIHKYIFKQFEWFFWPFVGELMIVLIGAALFLVCYLMAEK